MRLLVVCFSFLLCSFAAIAAETPNIVVVLADDLGFGDPQCYSAESKIPTPNMDRLALQGMRFTDAHSPSSVCTPTRYGILTGRFAWRTWLKSGVLAPYGSPLIERDRLTIPKMLKEHGYATGAVGKWHLGWNWTTTSGDFVPEETRGTRDELIDLTKPPVNGPKAAGFDYYFGTDVPNYPPYLFLENESYVGALPDRPKPDNMFGNPGRMQKGWKLERILPTLRSKAVEFIEDHEGKGPFFLYVPLTAPHTPIVPSTPWQGKSKAGDYGDLVAEVDGVLGAVMDALERTGAAGNTLLIMTSDNGSPARAGDPHIRNQTWAATRAVLRLFEHNPSNGWRGIKADVWEGGHRIPFFVRWPGKVPAGVANDALISSIDLMSTIARVVGHSLPGAAAVDSYDILPLCKGEKNHRLDRVALIHHSMRGVFCVRKGDWKLILGRGSGGFSSPGTIEAAALKPGEPLGQLYNLADDPGEKKNLWNARQDVVRELTEQLREYQESGRSRPVG